MKKSLKIEIQNPIKNRLLISFHGQMVLAQLEKEYASLMDSITKFNEIHLSISNVKEMDLSAYQFLAFIQKLNHGGKVIKFNLNVNDKIKVFLLKSGIDLSKLVENKN
ncbi:MAG: hypothetical protein KAI79_09395 [Bacteroidales bacterium]|nr:hypothetical protein [Bacteroidales bacterium]